MKSFLSCLTSVLFIPCLFSQNLIPNPSFEKVSDKINSSISITRKDFTDRVSYWFSPTNVTPDAFKLSPNNASMPYAFRIPQPVEGECLVGLYTNLANGVCKTYKEYISIKLKDTLSIKESYIMEFWMTSKESGVYDIGVFFDEKQLDLKQCSMLDSPAQFLTRDTIQQEQWKKISFEFKPRKPFSYVTIGNFERNEDINMQYLYLDNFLLRKNELPKKEKIEPTRPVVIEEIFNPRNILFEHGKYELLPLSFVELNKLVDYLKNKNKNQLTIEGHTDNSGSSNFNQQLSINRADAIKRYLLAKGIYASRITIIGYGQSRPIASNDTEEGRKLNRRVAFKIL